jgi:diaminohydroxyphosphoribosylaminopyrimidine deaminase / 5-amino-6-(5-phosphoribosylamino)uracil reductase
MYTDENYMHRCLALARLGAGNVAPNPMVGAVLVYKDTIIGEGYHQQYGQAHAEVNCLNSVSEENRHLIEHSTLYVSLEPCAHYGKTPPCSSLIIAHRIPRVVVGCRDPFKEVDGKGIQQLTQTGIAVNTGILEKECMALNKRFFTFYTQKRPFIILKWAQTADGFIAANDDTRLLISNDFTNRMVHQWRSEEQAILVGTNTAMKDNPSLTNRLFNGNNPIRLVIDLWLKLPAQLHIFDQNATTILFNYSIQKKEGNTLYQQLEKDTSIIPQILEYCYTHIIQSILIEGGAVTLQHFIDAGYWDEARIITNKKLHIKKGLPAPVLSNAIPLQQQEIAGDTINYLIHNSHQF